MKNIDLLRNSAQQAITNKIAWLCVLDTLIGQIVPAISQELPVINYVSSGIWFVSVIISTILGSGLVYSISQKELNHLDISVLEGWRKGWSKIIQVGLLNILILAVLFIFLLLLGRLFETLIPYGLLTTLFFGLLIRPILYFGVCAIIINNHSIGASVRISVLVFVRNIFHILVISFVLIVIQRVLLGILVLIFMSPYGSMIFTSPLKMLDIPEIMFYDQVLALILSPWIIIVFTHVYLHFNGASEVAVLSSRQEAV
jgi:hypothetical protein